MQLHAIKLGLVWIIITCKWYATFHDVHLSNIYGSMYQMETTKLWNEPIFSSKSSPFGHRIWLLKLLFMDHMNPLTTLQRKHLHIIDNLLGNNSHPTIWVILEQGRTNKLKFTLDYMTLVFLFFLKKFTTSHILWCICELEQNTWIAKMNACEFLCRKRWQSYGHP